MNTIEYLVNKIDILTSAIVELNNNLGTAIPVLQTTGVSATMMTRLNSVDRDFAFSKLRKYDTPENKIQLHESYFQRLFLLNPDIRVLDMTAFASQYLFIADPELVVDSLKLSCGKDRFTGGVSLEASLEFTADGVHTRLFNDDVYKLLTASLTLGYAEYYFSYDQYKLKHTPFKYLTQVYSELDAKAKASEVPVRAVVKDHNYANCNKYYYNSSVGLYSGETLLESSAEPWIGLTSYYQIDLIYGLIKSLKEALEKGDITP